MTQLSKQQLKSALGYRLRFRWKWFTAICVAITCSIAAVAPAQDPTPSVEAESISQRLEQQEAEIQWLRTRLSENLPSPPGSPAPSAADQREMLPEFGQHNQSVSPPAQFVSTTASGELDAVLRRLDTLEKNAAKAGADKKPDEGWTDVSSEKWTVKLGGHVQLDYINWATARSEEHHV